MQSAIPFTTFLCNACILYKAFSLTVVEEIPGRDVDEVIFFRSLDDEIFSISVEKSLHMQNCQDIYVIDRLLFTMKLIESSYNKTHFPLHAIG